MPLLFVPPDFGRLDGTFLNVDGSICDQFTFVPTETFARLLDGRFIIGVTGGVDGDFTTALRIYNELIVLLVTNTSLITATMDARSPLAHDYATTFYVLQVDQEQIELSVLRTISVAGVVGGTSWELPNSLGIASLALSRDLARVYYGRHGAFTGNIYRYNLNTSSAESNFFTGVSGDRLGVDLYVLADTSVLFLIRPASFASGPNPLTFEIRRYSAAGALLQTYAVGEMLGNAVGAPPRFVVEDDELSLWVMGTPVVGTQSFQQIRLSDGEVLESFTLPNVFGGQPDEDGKVSQSCPILFLARECSGVADEDCVIERPSTQCWGVGTPSVQALAETPTVSRGATWVSTHSPDRFQVGLSQTSASAPIVLPSIPPPEGPNQAPTAALARTSGATVGVSVSFSTSGSLDPDGTLASGFITWGDGESQEWSGPPPLTLSHTYDEAGSTTATLSVTDAGGLTDTADVTFSVGEPAVPGDGLRASDLAFDGFYEIPEGTQAGYFNAAGQGIAFRRVGDSDRLIMWGDYDPAHPTSFPLYEWAIPASAPGSTPSNGPNLTFVRNWGFVMDGHVLVDGSSGGATSDTTWHGGRLLWDAEYNGVWWTYGASYVAPVNHPSIGFTHFNDGTGVATSYGPWRVNSANTPDLVRGQIFTLPEEWATDHNGGRRFAAQGHMNSGVANMAHGPNARTWAPFNPLTTPASTLAGAALDGAPYVGGTARDLVRHDSTHKKTRNTRFRICGWIDTPSHHSPGTYDPSYGGWVHAESDLWGGPAQIGPYDMPNGTVERDTVLGATVIDIGGTYSVLFVGILAYTPEGYAPPGGQPWTHMWYGDATGDNQGYCPHGQPDPNWIGGTGVGAHYSRSFGWVYDVEQFLPVIAETVEPYELTPAVDELDWHQITNFPGGGNWDPPATEARAEMPHLIGPICYDPVDRKLWMVCRCDATEVFGQYVARIGVMRYSVEDR